MDRSSIRLTVFFEDPFWVGVLERTENNTVSACKITFGAEPKDPEVYDLILKGYGRLKFSPPVAAAEKAQKKNPKRVRREIAHRLEHTGIGTKSQQALKLQQEQQKIQRRVMSREQLEAEKQRQFALRKQKKKEKHRGR